MRSRPVPLTGAPRLVLLALLAVVVLVLLGRGTEEAAAVGEGTFALDKPEGYVTQEGTAVPVTVLRTGGATLTQDVVLTVQLSEGVVDEDYPSGTITQTYTFKQGTNEPSKTFMFQTLNKSKYYNRVIRVTILSVTGGAQIDYGASTAHVTLVGIFAPTVTHVAPRSANDGTIVTVTGTNFGKNPPGTNLGQLCAVNAIPEGGAACVDQVNFYVKGTSTLTTFLRWDSGLVHVIDQNHLTFVVPGASLANFQEYDIVVEVQTGQAAPFQRASSVRTVADRFTYTTGPTITGLYPNSGPAIGGTQVQLTGNGGLTCALAPTIFFDGFALPAVANNCVEISITGMVNIIKVISPPHSPGTIDIRAGNSPETAETKFTYTGGPKITSISPTFGPESGGTLVAINGTGFSNGYSGSVLGIRVLFGGILVPANDVTQVAGNSDTMILARAPASTGVRQITVEVVTTLGTFASPNTTAANFTYTTGPVIHSIEPANGPVTGGTVVTINGTGFLPGAVVKFGNTNAVTVMVDSGNVIRAVSPAGVGQVNISVTVGGTPSPNTAADDFTYSGPTVTQLIPNAGPIAGGNVIVVKGLNFTSTAIVHFGSVQVAADKVVFVSQNELTVTVPVGTQAQAVDVRVTTISGQSGVVPEDLYTYTSGPIIDAVNPSTGPTTGGTIVIITGKNFTAGLTVSFGGVNADNLNVNSATQVTVLTPPVTTAGIRDVRIAKGGDTSPINNNAKFSYVSAPPVITTLDPNSSSTFGGQEVTIIGAGFSGATCPGAVKFGTVLAPTCTVVNDTTLKTVTPPNVSGDTVVTVTTVNGTSAIEANFAYKSPSQGGTNGPGSGGTAPPPPGPAGSVTYSLTFRWTLLTWSGKDGIAIGDALRGFPPNAGSDVTSKLSAIFRWDAENGVYKGYFVASEGIPGANDFTTLTKGAIYWVATVAPGGVHWTVQQG